APTALASMLWPDPPLRITVAVSVLAVDDAQPVRPGTLKERPDRGDGPLGVRDEQAATPVNAVVLHVDYDQRGPGRVDADVRLDFVLGDVDQAVHAVSASESCP